MTKGENLWLLLGNSMENFEKFYISQVGILIRDDKCLILTFSMHPGEWGLPGGRIDRGEDWESAFRRELKEEINFDECVVGELLDNDIFYTESGTPYCTLVRYIENLDTEIVLSHEHTDYKWIGEDEIGNFNFVWDNLPRMIKKGFEYHNKLKGKRSKLIG